LSSSPTSETFSANSSHCNNSIDLRLTSRRSHPSSLVSSSESLQTRASAAVVPSLQAHQQASAASDSLLQAVVTPPRDTKPLQSSTAFQPLYCKPQQASAASDSLLQAVITPPRASAAVDSLPAVVPSLPATRTSLCSVRQPPTSRRTVTASHNKPLQRPTASYTPSTASKSHNKQPNHEYPHRNPRVCLHP
jgi:hypothetical protein